MNADAVHQVAVIGAGLMGHAIALDFAKAGYAVRLHDRGEEPLRRAMHHIERDLGLLRDAGRITAADVAAAMARIQPDVDLQAAVTDADVVIEAVFENLELKRTIFENLSRWSPERAILASNTSTFLPSSLAEVTNRADKVVVAHYFNPPHLLPLVELVRGAATSEETMGTMHELLTRVGKRPALVQREALGFVGNRLQTALLREALAIVEAGIATPEDVDAIITNGFGRRLAVAGVFEVRDLSGWDVTLTVHEQLLPEIASSTEISAQLRQRAASGGLTGGFTGMSADDADALRQRMARGLLAMADMWDG